MLPQINLHAQSVIDASGPLGRDQQNVAPAGRGLSEPGTRPGGYRFALSKGGGRPVCEALLRRLNQTHYDSPPYCGIPENDSIPGFSLLSRKRLTNHEGHELYPSIQVFSSTGGHALKGVAPASEEYLWSIRYRGQGDWDAVPAWRYAKPLDVENNGKPDDIVVWQGIRENTANECGKPEVNGSDYQRVTQQAFVIKPKSIVVDAIKTRDIFYRPPIDLSYGNGDEEQIYRPIGLTTNFFEYQGQVYFGGFYDAYDMAYGDIAGDRKMPEPTKITPSSGLGNTFDLFLRKDNLTTLVCEYQMSTR